MNRIYNLCKIILLAFIFTKCAYGQLPFKLDPLTGLHLLDGSGNPILNDKNWNTTPVFVDEFASEPNTRNLWNYQFGEGRGIPNIDLFVVTGDFYNDNMTPNCSSFPQYPNTNNYFGFTKNREFGSTPITSVTLKVVKETTPINSFWNEWGCNGGNAMNKYPKTYNYSTAQLLSKNAYKYGCFEARIKVNRPAGYQCKGLGQCFWLYANWSNSYPPPNLPSNTTRISTYSEIDIAENDPVRGLMTSNIWFNLNETNPIWGKNRIYSLKEGQYVYQPPTIFEILANGYNPCAVNGMADRLVEQTSYHTYTLTWTPTEINTFYDNELVKHIEGFSYDGKTCTPNMFDPMNIILDIEGTAHEGGDHQRWCRIIDNYTNLPFEYSIDYVKVYKLKNNTCSVQLNQPNYNFSTYTYGLKKSIVFGQNGCTSCQAKVQSGMNISLRASDFIELNDGFEVDNSTNTEFFATVNGNCSN